MSKEETINNLSSFYHKNGCTLFLISESKEKTFCLYSSSYSCSEDCDYVLTSTTYYLLESKTKEQIYDYTQGNILYWNESNITTPEKKFPDFRFSPDTDDILIIDGKECKIFKNQESDGLYKIKGAPANGTDFATTVATF